MSIKSTKSLAEIQRRFPGTKISGAPKRVSGGSLPKIRGCARCGDPHETRLMVYCQICRKWFCEACHKSDHVWQCQQRGTAGKSELEDNLAEQLRRHGIEMIRQVKHVIPDRRFVFDFGVPLSHKWIYMRWLLIEVQGAIHSSVWAKGGGRRARPSGHNSAAGIQRDSTKRNLATLAGHVVLSVTRADIQSGQAVEWIEQALKMMRGKS